MSFVGRSFPTDVLQVAGTVMDIGHERMVLADTGMVMGQDNFGGEWVLKVGSNGEGSLHPDVKNITTSSGACSEVGFTPRSCDDYLAAA